MPAPIRWATLIGSGIFEWVHEMLISCVAFSSVIPAIWMWILFSLWIFPALSSRCLFCCLPAFFSAFSIYFDRPFEIGDFIIVGEYAGTVKKIGMKSTRVQLLQGEELVLSNSELTKTNIRNFKKMKKRRINFSFGVTYDTPLKKLKKIPDIIKDIINPEKIDFVDRLDRVHFKEFGDFSLKFDIVYYVKSDDYAKYMDTQQEINYAIKEVFEKEGIEMAFPTQTIFLNK